MKKGWRRRERFVCEGKVKERKKCFIVVKLKVGQLIRSGNAASCLSFSSLTSRLHCLLNPPSLMPTEVVEYIYTSFFLFLFSLLLYNSFYGILILSFLFFSNITFLYVTLILFNVSQYIYSWGSFNASLLLRHAGVICRSC